MRKAFKEPREGIESVTFPNQNHEHLLRDVLGNGLGPAHLHGKAIDASLPPPV